MNEVKFGVLFLELKSLHQIMYFPLLTHRWHNKIVKKTMYHYSRRKKRERTKRQKFLAVSPPISCTQ